jgi:CheY-like chemotaxis protein
VGRPINILVEHNDEAFLFKTSVKSLAVSVTHVTDATKTILQLSSDDPLPDLIVFDLKLPGITSVKFSGWVASNPIVRKIPICIYTALPVISEEARKALRAAFYKTVNTAEIRTMVQQMCAFVGQL